MKFSLGVTFEKSCSTFIKCASTKTCSVILAFFYIKSSWLKEAFHELDMTSEVLEILMSPDSPYFRLSTFGHAGSAHVSSFSLILSKNC